jgi:hypothetical protein
MFEKRWYKVAVIRRIESLIKNYDLGTEKDLYDFKFKILKSLGLDQREGVFLRHLYLSKFDDLIANPFLTLRFYKPMELSKYSLEMLLGFLEEVESAASVISTFSNTRREAKVMNDGMKFLMFIEKTMKEGFRTSRENNKLALESSWTQITERKSANPQNWLVIPSVPKALPIKTVSQLGEDRSTRESIPSASQTLWLGTTAGNPTPVEMPTLSEERKRVLFGKNEEFLIKPQPVKEDLIEKRAEGFVRSASIPLKDTLIWIANFLFGALWVWLVFYKDYPSEQRLEHLFMEDRTVNSDPSPPKSTYHPMILNFVLSFTGLLIILWLGIWFDSVIESINSVPVETVLTEPPRSAFLFPSYIELIDWRDRLTQDSLAIVRSPQIGHGWSEPWSFNETWPPEWR